MPLIKTVLDINAVNEDAVFKQFKNVSGAGISPYTPVYIDTVSVTDGVAATQASTAQLQAGNLFLGIAAADTDNGTYGQAIIYGPATAVISQASAGTAPGAFMVGYGGYFDNAASISAAVASGWNQVILMETTAASVGFSSAAVTATYKVFVKAM